MFLLVFSFHVVPSNNEGLSSFWFQSLTSSTTTSQTPARGGSPLLTTPVNRLIQLLTSLFKVCSFNLIYKVSFSMKGNMFTGFRNWGVDSIIPFTTSGIRLSYSALHSSDPQISLICMHERIIYPCWRLTASPEYHADISTQGKALHKKPLPLSLLLVRLKRDRQVPVWPSRKGPANRGEKLFIKEGAEPGKYAPSQTQRIYLGVILRMLHLRD